MSHPWKELHVFCFNVIADLLSSISAVRMGISKWLYQEAWATCLWMENIWKTYIL